MLEVHKTKVPNYVVRVNYKAKGMTERASEQSRINPRSQPESCPYDHRFHTMFQLDYYTSVILSKNPLVGYYWID
jgi:hypothetical protein